MVYHTKSILTSDNYMTPKSAWENITHLIPKDKIIYEPFYGDGKSGEYLRELGFDVIHEPVDFFESDLGEIIVSNPPFSQIKKILKRMMELDKPFIFILPSSRINAGYFKEWKDKLQIIIPPKRILFEKLTNGERSKKSANFDCFYYCYKMGLEKDITWLDK